MKTLESLNMTELKQIKAHLEECIADLQRKLRNIEELMELELGQAKSHKDTESVIGRFLKSKDIEKAILSIDGVFSAKDVPAAVEKMFPGKIHYGKSVIPNALIKLERANKLEYVERRSGQTPATYRRIGKGKN